MPLPHIPVTAFLQTDLFLANSDPPRNLSDELQWQARTNVDMSTWCPHIHVRPHCFILTEACSCRLELAYFAQKISKNRPVCKNAVALVYYGSCRLLVMGSWRYRVTSLRCSESLRPANDTPHSLVLSACLLMKPLRLILPIGPVRYINILTWIWGFRIKIAFFKSFLSLNSQKRLGYKENITKYRSLSWKPRGHVRILIYRAYCAQCSRLCALDCCLWKDTLGTRGFFSRAADGNATVRFDGLWPPACPIPETAQENPLVPRVMMRTCSHTFVFSPKESASPWPKFDKAVSELHDWLDTLSEMMKTEKTVLGDSEDMEGLLEKQKVNRESVAG